MSTSTFSFVLVAARLILGSTFVVSLLLAAHFLYSSGYETGKSFLHPNDTVSIRLDLSRADHSAWQDVVRGWTNGRQEGVAGPRPALFVADSIPPRFNAAGFEMLADTNPKVLRYREASFGKRLLLMWLGATHRNLSLGLVLLFCGGSWLLWQLARDVTPNSPFTPANARRLGLLTMLLVALLVWQELAHYLVGVLVPAFSLGEGYAPLHYYVALNGDTDLPDSTVVLMLGVISLVYERGVRFQQEAELTI